MSKTLEAIFPSVFQAYRKYLFPTGLIHMAGAFIGYVVNIRSSEASLETEPHHDVKE